MKAPLRIATVAVVLLVVPAAQAETVWSEDFEQYDAGTALHGQQGWSGYDPQDGRTPTAVVRPEVGLSGGKALALWHKEPFRADNIGLRRKLDAPREGTLWLQLRYKPAPETTGPLYAAALGGWAAIEPKDDEFRCHASWLYSYWRLYTPLKRAEDHWYTVTLQIDTDQQTYSAWVDETVLGEGLPMVNKSPKDGLYLAAGGSAEQPALVDQMTLTTTPPEGVPHRPLLPEPKEGLLFRFAGVGDPQLGFADYKGDMERLKIALRQIDRSGADLTLFLGDLVHEKDQEQAYKDFRQLAERLKRPWYPVRGNHDRTDLYQKHMGRPLDYSFTHKGVAFVMLDAVGQGVSDEQLAWLEAEFQKASQAKQEIIVCCHVSPWDANDRGASQYFQVGPGKERLRELLQSYGVLAVLSGHYHRGLWHHEQQGTHFLVLPATGRVRFSSVGWCLFDVYPDRVEVHFKPLFFAYDREDVEQFYDSAYSVWKSYDDLRRKWPYVVQGPLTIRRR